MISRTDILNGLLAYLVSSSIVAAAVVFGFHLARKDGDKDDYPKFDHWDALNRYDGGFYRNIAENGYRWKHDQEAVMAFFPVYPILIRAGTETTGARDEYVTLVISHLFLAASFILLHAYIRRRTGDAKAAGMGVLALAVVPTGFFFRLGYSESAFFFLIVLFLIALELRTSLWILALIAGIATGTRAPGIALPLVFAVELWRRHPGFRSFLPRLALFGPLACSGLLAFIIYQWAAFGDPLAFVKVQSRWGLVRGKFEDTIVPLATYEPFWGTYVSDSPRYWRKNEQHDFRAFSLVYASPIYYTATLFLIFWGARARWLKGNEVVLSLALLAVPYFSKGYANSMNSFGRFASVVAPVYLVLGHLLVRCSALAIGLLAIVAVFFLVVYAAMFGAGWPML